MQEGKTVSFTAGLGLAAALWVLVLAVNASPGIAQDDLRRELVPGLDLWTQERQAAPHWDSKETTPDLLSRAARHREFMEAGVPVEYRSRASPYPAATTVIQDGGRLYKAYCATCHGAKALGTGLPAETSPRHRCFWPI